MRQNWIEVTFMWRFAIQFLVTLINCRFVSCILNRFIPIVECSKQSKRKTKVQELADQTDHLDQRNPKKWKFYRKNKKSGQETRSVLKQKPSTGVVNTLSKKSERSKVKSKSHQKAARSIESNDQASDRKMRSTFWGQRLEKKIVRPRKSAWKTSMPWTPEGCAALSSFIRRK